jgi:hypothetical protein
MLKMKNVLFIGDIHGNPEWDDIAKDALNKKHDIIFLGDFCDSFFQTPVEQLDNLKNICEFIRKNKKYVTALLGNHDYSYIHNIDSISGKQYAHAYEYKKIFDDNIDLFQMAWGYTNPTTGKYTLATHAGLTKNFYEFILKPEIRSGEKIHKTLNRLQNKKEIMWAVGRMRGGRGIPGPLWCDYQEFLEDPYTGINQVFGHTPLTKPRIDNFGDDFVACIDSRGNLRVESMTITL